MAPPLSLPAEAQTDFAAEAQDNRPPEVPQVNGRPVTSYTLREIKALPKAQRGAILRGQAALAAPLYAADLALPARERELTAFSALDDYDPFLDPVEYPPLAP